MVIIPPGRFQMGATPTDDEARKSERPQHWVTIDYRFAVGKYPVTFAEFDHFVASEGYGLKADDHGRGRGKRPVGGVRWDDAKAYCRWLSEQTGKLYRLLSESEWEYVCRAGTTTKYWWGEDVGEGRCNCDGIYRGTTAVDTFAPNPFGLHDTHGNVREWVEDCWVANYERAPIDGSARSRDPCSDHVTRGGYWAFEPQYVRAAFRGSAISDTLADGLGFRVARTMSE